MMFSNKKGSGKRILPGLFSSKRGIEIGINFIVMLIIGILIFGLSLSFLFKWFGSAEELKGEIDKQTEEQIMTALKTGHQRVAIPFSVQETKRGQAVTFGVGVRNIKESKQFSTATEFSAAYSPNGESIPVDPDYINDFWLGAFKVSQGETIKKNDQKVVPVLIKADTSMASNVATQKGDYVFNICVYDAPPDINGNPPVPCTVQQYGLDSGRFYTKKIYQVTVRVI
jgi:hypothetical protein